MKKRTRKKSFGRGRNRGSSRRWDERIHEEIWIAKKKKNHKEISGKKYNKKKEEKQFGRNIKLLMKMVMMYSKSKL